MSPGSQELDPDVDEVSKPSADRFGDDFLMTSPPKSKRASRAADEAATLGDDVMSTTSTNDDESSLALLDPKHLARSERLLLVTFREMWPVL